MANMTPSAKHLNTAFAFLFPPVFNQDCHITLNVQSRSLVSQSLDIHPNKFHSEDKHAHIDTVLLHTMGLSQSRPIVAEALIFVGKLLNLNSKICSVSGVRKTCSKG